MSSTTLDASTPAHLSTDWVIDASDLTRATGTKKLRAITELQALLDWPGLYKLAKSCDELFAEHHEAKASSRGQDPAKPVRGRGRPRIYPTVLLLAVAMAARITGSLASALSLVHDQSVWWGQLRPVWESRGETEGDQFPLKAPNRDLIRHFINQLLAIPGWEQKLQARFQRISVAQARALGNLSADSSPDWARPSLAQTVIGDGQVIEPWSDVIQYVDPVTGEIRYRGSRAETTPRVAPTGTDLRHDGKTHLKGLNMVQLLTPTEFGWVVLGTGTAQGAEQWASLDLLDSIAELAGGGIHNLLWDRVYNGWLLDYALAKHRIRVFNRSVGDGDSKTQDPSETEEATQRYRADEEWHRLTSDARYQVQLADLGDQPTGTPDKRHERLQSNLLHNWRNKDLYEIFRSGAPQPLGISLYRPTSSSGVKGSRNQSNRIKMEIVRSKFNYLKEESHNGIDGPCSHELYVDDGALHSVEVDPDLGCLVKVATATCRTSKPRMRAGGRWATTEVWKMPCQNGDFEFETAWDPQHHRFTPETPSEVKKTPDDMVLNQLRPISRSQEQDFADIANYRNIAESFNRWYQRRLPIHGRAASLSADGQAFDLLAGACVLNAITWTVWQQTA